MNKQPVVYYQTDKRWAALPYAAAGETATIGGSGCGPTAMAMVLATWADPKVTPQTECAWALKNGFKALKHGTFYAYFTPAAARYGLTCSQLNGVSLYGNSGSGLHAQVLAAVKKGDLVIACMGPGNWTSGGHFVLLWDVDTEQDIAYVNDPASALARRTRGSWRLFKSQLKFYFRILRPRAVEIPKEESTMTNLEIRTLIDEQVKVAVANARKELVSELLAQLPQEPVFDSIEEIPENWDRAREAVQAAVDAGALQGTGSGLGLTLTMLRMIVIEYRARRAREMGME